MGIAKKIIIAVVAVPCVLIASVYIRNKAVGPEGWAMDDTENHLRARLKDPDSLVIRTSETFVTTDPNDGSKTIHICGTFDGKNSFGAYGGPTRFVSRSISSQNSFQFVSVTVEESDDVELARRANMPSSFEKVYWAPNCMH